MSDPKITRFEPHGPAGTGLQEWDRIDPATLEAGNPTQRGHIYHHDAATGLMVGLWDCTPMAGRLEPYEVNEFMFLLEGAVTIVGADGGEVTISAGEPFVIPKGLPCAWKQEGYVRKFFMIFPDGSGQAPADPSALAVIRPRAAGPEGGMARVEIPDPSLFMGDTPAQNIHRYFTDMTGQMTVGLWDSTPFERAAAPFPRCELMCLLEGSVSLTDGAGAEHRFEAGEAAYIPMGAPCGWRSTEYVRKFFAIFQPAVAVSAQAAE